MNESYEIQDYIPNSLAVGDDEGGNALIYFEGAEGFGLYIIPALIIADSKRVRYVVLYLIGFIHINTTSRTPYSYILFTSYIYFNFCGFTYYV